jgi:hypothetical protein
VDLARGVARQGRDEGDIARTFEARQIVAAMRDDCGLSYPGDLIKDVFDFGRIDVFAAGDVDVFPAIDDVEAVLADARGIAGVQLAIGEGRRVADLNFGVGNAGAIRLGDRRLPHRERQRCHHTCKSSHLRFPFMIRIIIIFWSMSPRASPKGLREAAGGHDYGPLAGDLCGPSTLKPAKSISTMRRITPKAFDR